MSSSTSQDPDPAEMISEPPPHNLRIEYFIRVWGFKALIGLALGARRLVTRPPQSQLRPEVKSYPIRPQLHHRVFVPELAGDKKLPMYLDLHGGGWAVTDPEEDDGFCSLLAQDFNIVVISIEYHKASTYPFPIATTDVEAVTNAILHDESLNIDVTKVAIGGFSAGGNLAFAACQTDCLKGRISAIVGIYPCLDLSESMEDKLKRRPKEAPFDFLESQAKFVAWAYVPYGINRRDPLLSPRWAKTEDLPRNVYLVGAEYDMLCHEALETAKALVNPEVERKPIPGIPPEDGWSQGGIRWEIARGRQHAFTHVPLSGQKEVEILKAVDELYHRLGAWLTKEVWVE